jgi:cullin 3
MHLIPLIKSKVLLKNPAQNSFNLEDKISVNLDFKSNSVRNKIPVLVSKNVKEQDNFRTQGKVEDDRRYQIEAAIIKVMKARRSIDH